MPLVRIDLRAGKSAEYRRALGNAVHQAMIDTINIPEADRFQIINEHAKDGLMYDAKYLDIERTDDIIIIQITLNAGRIPAQKTALYKKVVELLVEKIGVRPQNVLINLVEVTVDNWSFGNGIAQYASVKI